MMWHLAVLDIGVSKKNIASILRVRNMVSLSNSTTVRLNLNADSHGPIIRRNLHNIHALIHGVSSYHSADNRSTDLFVYTISINGYQEMIISLNTYAIN